MLGTTLWGLPTGAALTPDAAPGAILLELDPHLAGAPDLRAGGAMALSLSPDGRTLLLLTSGYNRFYDVSGAAGAAFSGEYVFVYDVTEGAPREVGVLSVPNSFFGLVHDPQRDRFYVSGGPDDLVREFGRDPGGQWAERLPPIPLGHSTAQGLGGLGIDTSPLAAGIGMTRQGDLVVVANHQNDSVSLIDPAARTKAGEVALAPGGGVAGGEFPLDITVVASRRAFVTCQRDREVVEVDLDRRFVTRRIPVGGEPTRLLSNAAGSRLFVANANSDTVSVVDVASGAVISSIPTASPPGSGIARAYRGSNPNALALSPDERTLYVANAGNSAVAVIGLSERDSDTGAGGTSEVRGLIPTGFYPHAVARSADGRHLYVAHGKSATGPNPGGPWSDSRRSSLEPYAPGIANQFSLQLTRGGLLALPVPSAEPLAKLTAQVLVNNGLDRVPAIPPVFTALRGSVKHVIYVVGENRTYDQILGDLEGADGDRHLVHWGQAITPNHHALARAFVTLDRFFDAGGVSGDGWEWTTSGRTTDVAEKEIPLEYAGRGRHSYDWEGMNRNVNVGLSTAAARLAANPHTPASPDLLPGTADVGAVDGPSEGGRGFLWDAALAAGVTIRNYGAFLDDTRYSLPKSDPAYLPLLRTPYESRTRVAFPTRASLQDSTDPYYRGFDMELPDYWRVREWEREFQAYERSGDLPGLEIVRLPHDHLGQFDSAIDGVNTPDTQIADNDYALGLLVERVSHSPFWKDTVIVALEDDAQNGSDHVDAHRSFLLVAGGHVRRGAVVSTVYSTPSVLRTIELLLGLEPLAQEDAVAPPMAEVLVTEVDLRPFTATLPPVLLSTSLPLQVHNAGPPAFPRGDAAGWAADTAGFDFSHADALPAEAFNRVLYCSLVESTGCRSVASVPACVAGVAPEESQRTIGGMLAASRHE